MCVFRWKSPPKQVTAPLKWFNRTSFRYSITHFTFAINTGKAWIDNAVPFLSVGNHWGVQCLVEFSLWPDDVLVHRLTQEETIRGLDNRKIHTDCWGDNRNKTERQKAKSQVWDQIKWWFNQFLLQLGDHSIARFLSAAEDRMMDERFDYSTVKWTSSMNTRGG